MIGVEDSVSVASAGYGGLIVRYRTLINFLAYFSKSLLTRRAALA
jgi:hypothetical protein